MLTIRVANSASDIQACLCIRDEVFIREQGVPEAEEHDSHDEEACHFLALKDGHPVGTARVLLRDNGTIAKIGRVAVLRAKRQQGVGRALIQAIEQDASVTAVQHFALDAQTHALPFYMALGYSAHGDEFMEAGIPHLHMSKANPKRGGSG